MYQQSYKNLNLSIELFNVVNSIHFVLNMIMYSTFENMKFNIWHPYFILSGLYELWKTGRYKSYPPSMLVDLVARILALVPPWTRVYRVQRSAVNGL